MYVILSFQNYNLLMIEPLVSVIMNCYNGEGYLKEALESVLTQSYANFEIIFWDNVSTDSTRTLVDSYHDKRIKYFLAEKHVSLGEARNLAIQKAQGKYIAFLDVDDVWLTEKLAEQIQHFNEPEIGLVYCNTNRINSKGKVLDSQGKSADHNHSKISFIDLFKNYDITLSSAIVSAQALNSANGFFDNILVYAEEYDLFLRICLNYKAIRIRKILASYRVHEKQETLKFFERGILENEYINSKLLLINEKAFKENPELLDLKSGQIAWEKFLNDILNGHVGRGRRKIWPYVFKDLKYFAFYFLSFLGSDFIKSIWDQYLRRKGRLPFLS